MLLLTFCFETWVLEVFYYGSSGKLTPLLQALMDFACLSFSHLFVTYKLLLQSIFLFVYCY